MLAQAHSGISPSGGGLGCQNREPTAALSCDRGEFGPDRIRDGGTVGGNFCAGFRIVQRDVEVGHGWLGRHRTALDAGAGPAEVSAQTAPAITGRYPRLTPPRHRPAGPSDGAGALREDRQGKKTRTPMGHFAAGNCGVPDTISSSTSCSVDADMSRSPTFWPRLSTTTRSPTLKMSVRR